MAHIECICPPKADGETRHPDGDTIELRERLGLREALTARNVFLVLRSEDPDAGTAEILAALSESYLLLGIRDWTVVDAKGKRVEPTKAAIREYLFPHVEAAMVVADEADELYSESVVAPLVNRASNSSPPTPISDSTSPTSGPSSPPRTRRKPSSTTHSQTGGTVTTLRRHDGDSSYSQSSA